MGRIIYKGRGVSHIYLWVAIAFYELSAATPPAIFLDVPHLIGWSAELYFDSACINSARAVSASLRALLST